MGEWKIIKLSEVLKEKTERNKNNKTDLVLSVTNSQGFVKQSDFFEGTVHSEDISNYKLVRKNEFAYNPSRINVGSIDILKEYDIGALSPMYVIFSVDETRLLPDYFKYYFQTHRFNENVKNNTQGSVRNSLSFKALSEFEYLLPPLEEQKRIVKILDQVNKIIERYQNLINEKEQFIKSQFVEMFINNSSKQWNNCRIGDIYDFQYGTGNTIPEDNGEYLVYGSNGVVGHHIAYNAEEGPIIGHIGAYAGIVNWANGKHFVTYNGVICKLKDNNVNPIFGYYLLKNQKYDVLARNGGAQPFVSYESLEKPSILLPPYQLQNKFARLINLIDKQKFHSLINKIFKVKESEVYA